MIIWSLLLTAVLFIKHCNGFRNLAQNKPYQEGAENTLQKPHDLINGKVNFIRNGSLSGDFGRFANALAETVAYRKSDINRRSTDKELNKELLKDFIVQLLSSGLTGDSRFFKRNSKNEAMVAAFVPKMDSSMIPVKVPSVFGHTDKCVYKSAECWCKEQPITYPCTWPTDVMCETTVTCGPTKPCWEHRDKWCFDRTPDVYAYRTTNPCFMKPPTIPYCRTTMHTPCKTFTPPCVWPTPHTYEPCVCPTCPPPTCPCPVARLHPEFLSLLYKRAAQLPDPLKNRTIALLRNRRLCKRLLSMRDIKQN